MTKISYLNGEFLAHEKCLVHIEDRGFQFADSVYEVILFNDGKLIEQKNHLLRLKRSLREMMINFEFDLDDLASDICSLFGKNNIHNGFCYLSVSRGYAPRIRSHPQNAKPTISITVNSLKKLDNDLQPISATTDQDIRWQRCDIKSTALAAPSMILQKAINAGFDEVIMIRDGFITEASFANIFIVDQHDKLITRHADNLILEGVTRNRIIEIAKNSGIEVEERSFKVSEMMSAKEVFTTATTFIIKPISKIDNNIIGNGQSNLANRLYQSYLDFVATN